MSLTIFVNTIVITVLHIDFEPLGSPKTDSTPKINPQQWVDHPESPITFDGPSTHHRRGINDLMIYLERSRAEDVHWSQDYHSTVAGVRVRASGRS